MKCPNCERECEEIDLVSHDGDCDCCDGELDTLHCGCYYDWEPRVCTQLTAASNRKPAPSEATATENQQKPAAWQKHQIMAVLRDGETFKGLAKQVQYCEISWPQSCVMGEPIRIQTNERKITNGNLAGSQQADP